MAKKILLIAGNYYPEPTGIGRYNAEMIDWLADNGFECTVLSTYPYYPHWKVQEPYQHKKNWFSKETKITAVNNTITVYRCPQYVPVIPSGKKRMLLDLSYFVSVAITLLAKKGKKYDYVISVAPPLLLGLTAVVFKNFSNAKLLYHIQDLQVDAAKDLNIISSPKIIKLLFKLEKYILKKADRVTTISEGMQRKISTKTNKPVMHFPNWSNTKMFVPLNNKRDLKLYFGFNTSVPVILYSGAIGEKQGLESILDAAQYFQDECIAANFVICGSGPYMEVLEKEAGKLKLNNIIFLPLQPNEKLNAFLNMADVHLIIQKAVTAELVMPSKLTNILSVGGLAVITANRESSLYEMVSKYGMGLLCPAENTNELIKTIKHAVTDKHQEIRINARKYAETFLSIDKVMQRYVDEVMTGVIVKTPDVFFKTATA